MSGEEICEFYNDKLAPLAVTVSKDDDNIGASDGKELGDTDRRQADNCEEFRGRVQTVIDGIGKTYHSFEEDLPRLPVYDPSFDNVKTLCIGLVKEAESLLKSSPYQDEETARLVQLASESQTIQYPPARKIGLMGDSASGESSLFLQYPYLLIQPRQEHVGQRAIGFAGACTGGRYHPLPQQLLIGSDI